MVNKHKLKIGSRSQVMHGSAKITSGGLSKKDLKYNKNGKIISRKASNSAKKRINKKTGGFLNNTDNKFIECKQSALKCLNKLKWIINGRSKLKKYIYDKIYFLDVPDLKNYSPIKECIEKINTTPGIMNGSKSSKIYLKIIGFLKCMNSANNDILHLLNNKISQPLNNPPKINNKISQPLNTISNVMFNTTKNKILKNRINKLSTSERNLSEGYESVDFSKCLKIATMNCDKISYISQNSQNLKELILFMKTHDIICMQNIQKKIVMTIENKYSSFNIIPTLIDNLCTFIKKDCGEIKNSGFIDLFEFKKKYKGYSIQYVHVGNMLIINGYYPTKLTRKNYEIMFRFIERKIDELHPDIRTKIKQFEIKTIIFCGNFNDYSEELLSKSYIGHVIFMNQLLTIGDIKNVISKTDKKKIPKTCCPDDKGQFMFRSDYIFTNHYMSNINTLKISQQHLAFYCYMSILRENKEKFLIYEFQKMAFKTGLFNSIVGADRKQIGYKKTFINISNIDFMKKKNNGIYPKKLANKGCDNNYRTQNKKQIFNYENIKNKPLDSMVNIRVRSIYSSNNNKINAFYSYLDYFLKIPQMFLPEKYKTPKNTKELTLYIHGTSTKFKDDFLKGMNKCYSANTGLFFKGVYYTNELEKANAYTESLGNEKRLYIIGVSTTTFIKDKIEPFYKMGMAPFRGKNNSKSIPSTLKNMLHVYQQYSPSKIFNENISINRIFRGKATGSTNQNSFTEFVNYSQQVYPIFAIGSSRVGIL
jgi:hypothetical protein